MHCKVASRRELIRIQQADRSHMGVPIEDGVAHLMDRSRVKGIRIRGSGLRVDGSSQRGWRNRTNTHWAQGGVAEQCVVSKSRKVREHGIGTIASSRIPFMIHVNSRPFAMNRVVGKHIATNDQVGTVKKCDRSPPLFAVDFTSKPAWLLENSQF